MATALAEIGIVLGETPPTSSDSVLQHLKEKTPVKKVDVYSKLKSLQRKLEFLNIQEEYIKDEQKNLKRELIRAKEEVKRIQSVPLVIGQFLEMVDADTGIVSSTTGQTYYVRILSTINRELLKPNSSIALHRISTSVVDVLPPEVGAKNTCFPFVLKSVSVALFSPCTIHCLGILSKFLCTTESSVVPQPLCFSLSHTHYTLLLTHIHTHTRHRRTRLSR